MKLPSLLSQYLRDKKILSLPGIGIFHLSAYTPIAENTELLSSHIQFENKKVREHDDNFIDFIKQQTGKIKPLAIADLETYLETGLQLLNIGKPFYIDGIGSILKNKNGEYEFTPREITTTRAEQTAHEHEKRVSVFEEHKYEPKVNPWQKIIVGGLLLGGLAVVILGGYYLYNKHNNPETQTSGQQLADTPVQHHNKVDSPVVKQDSTSLAVQAPQVISNSYKFVIKNTSNKKSALARYNQLKGLPIMMETTDSINYKIYFRLTANPADTAYIRDSLSRWYATKVFIEQ